VFFKRGVEIFPSLKKDIPDHRPIPRAAVGALRIEVEFFCAWWNYANMHEV
jgi:hypothetical protein